MPSTSLAENIIGITIAASNTLAKKPLTGNFIICFITCILSYYLSTSPMPLHLPLGSMA